MGSGSRQHRVNLASIGTRDHPTARFPKACPEGRPRVHSKKRITSFDIAEKAGVSQATVSRALRGDPSVSEETRRRVEAAAATLNYTRSEERRVGKECRPRRTPHESKVAQRGEST